MVSNPNSVIIEEGICSFCCATHIKNVRHRDFPEIRAECPSVIDALSHLVNQLERTTDYAETQWQRDSIEQAITDILDVLKTLQQTEIPTDHSCPCVIQAPAAPLAQVLGPGILD